MILELLKNIENFKNYTAGDDLDMGSLPALKKFLYFQKTQDYIFSNINLLSAYPILPETDSMVLIDILVFNRLVDHLGKNEVQLITLFAMLKNKTEPNYDMLPKIYGSKIKISKIIDLLFNDDPNIVLGLFKLIEYIKQRDLTLEEILIRLIRARCIIWTFENEKKSVGWYLSYFNTISTVPETIETIEKLFSE